MEDILASIRRILSEEEPSEPEGETTAGGEDVLVLDPSMIVDEPQPKDSGEKPMAQDAQTQPARAPQPAPAASSSSDGELVAPEAAAAAAASVGSLVRTLAGRAAKVSQAGPTLEDIVRDEIRPMLKQWLDTQLPPIVERLVRLEIERVVGRAEL
jgi:cell pole-organizing protein PopZ